MSRISLICCLCVTVFLSPCAAATFTYTSPSTGLSYSITAENITVTLDGKTVMSGQWTISGAAATFAIEDAEAAPGAPITRSMEVINQHSVRLTQKYKNWSAVHTLVMNGEDLQISSAVQNIDDPLPLRMVRLSGLTVHFPVRPAGFVPSFHWTYLRQVGAAIMHPSRWAPIGAVYASHGDLGFSAFTSSHLDRQKFFHCPWEKDGVIPAACAIEMFIPDPIESGQSKTFNIHIRLSKNGDWKHLLAPYKETFDRVIGKQQYVAEDRPAAFFASADRAWVRDDNPHGFNDGGGTSIWRRFDQAGGVEEFLARVADPLKEAGGQGCIFWILQGHNPRGAMYRPDFDVFPPEIAANIPALTKGFAARNLRAGLCARPGEAVDRTDWKTDDTFRLHADSKSQMDRLWSRFDRTIKMGFNLYYLDSFGENYNDYLIMKMLRKKMGPNILTYSEFGSDVILPFSGRYLEHRDGSIMWITPQLLEIQRWLVPDASFVCKFLDETSIEQMGEKRLTPLIEDHQIKEKVSALKSLGEKRLKGERWK
jgi:hypothetical protein